MFKEVFWYEYMYEISSKWEVKSLWSGRWWLWKERIMMPQRVNKIYSRVSLSNKWKVISYKIHRLVATAFIPNPNNYPLVCHKDETLDEKWLLNNSVDNLFWWTHIHNVQDMLKKWRGNIKSWIDNSLSKSIDQYTLEWEFIKRWWATRDVERALGIAHTSISYCCLWKLKTAGKFIWKYAV